MHFPRGVDEPGFDLLSAEGLAEDLAQTLAQIHQEIERAFHKPDANGCIRPILIGEGKQVTLDGEGYPFFKLAGKYFHAHRVFYEMKTGLVLPDNVRVVRFCKLNPKLCCSHVLVQEGTEREIVFPLHHRTPGRPHKLTAEQVRDIRAARKEGATYRTIGDRYGVSAAIIRVAVLGGDLPLGRGCPFINA